MTCYKLNHLKMKRRSVESKNKHETWEQNWMVPELATQQSYGLVFYVKFSDIKYLYSIT